MESCRAGTSLVFASLTLLLMVAAAPSAAHSNGPPTDEVTSTDQIIEELADLEHEIRDSVHDHHARHALKRSLREARDFVERGKHAWQAGNERKAMKKFRKARRQLKHVKRELRHLRRHGHVHRHVAASLRQQTIDVIALLDALITEKETEAPTADAGLDQVVPVGATVVLDGSGSLPESSALNYAWTLVVRPATSSAALLDPTAVMPMFVADVAGEYRVELVVSDAAASSAADAVVVTAVGLPIADAGPDQKGAPINAPVTLDGSGSMDPSGLPLSFQWSFDFPADGTAPALSDPTAVMPTFIPENEGVYVAELVVDNGVQSSAPDFVAVVTANSPVGHLGCGDLVSGSIDLPGQMDSFMFRGTAGDVVAVAIGGTNIAARVFAPSGAPVTVFFTRAQQIVTLGESGMYVVEVVGASFTATGDYSLGLECLVPPSADAVPLTCGSLVDGSIDSVAETDLFTFAGRAGEVVAVTITGANMAARVVSPSGAASPGSVVGTQQLLTLTETGTYVVEVVGANSTATGDYVLGLECLVPPSADALPLNCGSLVDGSIESASEKDLFTFDGTAGDVIAVTIAGANVAARVFSPSGAPVTEFIVRNQRLLTLAESGTYVIEIVGASFTATGDYLLGLACLVPPDAAAAPLSCGDVASGSIDSATQTDLFTLNGMAGDVFAVTITGANTAARVVAPSGNTTTSFFRSQATVTLAESGTHTLQVVGDTFTGTGDYTLGVACLVPTGADAVPLVCGTPQTGSIDIASETDLFTFEGTAG